MYSSDQPQRLAGADGPHQLTIEAPGDVAVNASVDWQWVVGELHDFVMQPLIAARLFDEACASERHLDQHRAACRGQIEAAIAATARMMRGQSPRQQDGASIDDALRRQLDEVAHGWGAPIDVDVDTSGARLSGPEGRAFVRAVRETVVNAARHADATLIRVRAWQAERALIARVVDDGCGFDQHQPPAPCGRAEGGIGLRSTTDQLRGVGGELLIRSASAQGTSVIVKVPMPSAVAASLG